MGENDEHPELQALLEAAPDGGSVKVCGDGSVDFHGSPAAASSTGGYTAAAPLLFMDVLVAMSLYGVSYNLVLYMVDTLRLSSAAAATHVSMWNCAHDLSPLLVAYVADAHLGRFRATLLVGGIFFAGIAMLAASTVGISNHVAGSEAVFFLALYLVALGKGFVAPLVAFGADQFDATDAREAVAKSSYFSWYYFCGSTGLLLAVVGVVYVGDRAGFSSAATLCAAAMAAALLALLSGVRRYRYKTALGNPFAGIGSDSNAGAKLGRISLIWCGCVVYEAMRSQTMALFVEQAALLDTQAWGQRIPPASLNCFDPASVLFWTVIYDKLLRPLLAKLTGNSKGFTLFQRMGTGLLVMTMAMACAAVVERCRLDAAHNLETRPSVLWQIPQFAFVGASKVFYYVGFIEFLYDQVPENLKTLGTSFSFLAASAGSFLSGLLVTLAQAMTGWIPRDLDQGHLDYFFWMLVVLGIVNWFFFMACSYTYRT